MEEDNYKRQILYDVTFMSYLVKLTETRNKKAIARDWRKQALLPVVYHEKKF